jgi:pimeloyl-ACP methyl ester carboxylesterase
LVVTEAVNDAVRGYLAGLEGGESPVRLSWEQWLAIGAPYKEVGFTQKEVTARYSRNGYDWDIHGSLYTPAKEVDPSLAFVFFHGGADSESVFDLTPDGRPGQARALAAQGFTVLAISYPGHFPPGNKWQVPIAERQPLYLLDRDLPRDEVLDRNLKCTFNTILQGAGQLVSENLPGRDILAWGHSTGGPMSWALTRFAPNNKVIGMTSFGTGGPDGWRKEWREATGAEKYVELPVDHVSRRSPHTYREAGYEDPADLMPWGGPEELFKWASWSHRSQIKTSLCDNQHRGIVKILEEYPKRTGLPLEEYVDHLEAPDPAWLRSIAVLALVGDNDKGHWVCNGKDLPEKREMYMARKFREAGVARNHVVLIPRYGHFGFMELHNEKFVYLWLWALKQGYFGKRG